MQVKLLGRAGSKRKGKGDMARKVSCSPLFSNPAATHRPVRLDRSPTSEGTTPDSLLLCRFLPAHRRNKGGAK